MKKTKFRCIKDVFFNDGNQRAFIKGNRYYGELDHNSYYFMDEFNPDPHKITLDFLKKHFKFLMPFKYGK
jgi:hypothetical protein